MVQGTTADDVASNGHPGTGALDLQPFCSTSDEGDYRKWLKQPFSVGEYTYATNGHIAMRVPRRAEIPAAENEKAVKAAGVLDHYFKPLSGATFRTVTESLPSRTENIEQGPCDYCEGRGKDHECPDCTCVCDACGGSGVKKIIDKISVAAFGALFRLPYLLQIVMLPTVEVSDVEVNYTTPKPLLFRFDGGVAALMPLRKPYEEHIDLSEPSKD